MLTKHLSILFTIYYAKLLYKSITNIETFRKNCCIYLQANNIVSLFESVGVYALPLCEILVPYVAVLSIPISYCIIACEYVRLYVRLHMYIVCVWCVWRVCCVHMTSRKSAHLISVRSTFYTTTGPRRWRARSASYAF